MFTCPNVYFIVNHFSGNIAQLLKKNLRKMW